MKDKRNTNRLLFANKKLKIGKVKSTNVIEGDAVSSKPVVRNDANDRSSNQQKNNSQSKKVLSDNDRFAKAQKRTVKTPIDSGGRIGRLVRPSGPFATTDSEFAGGVTTTTDGSKENFEQYPLTVPPELFIEEGDLEADVALLAIVSDLHIGDGSARDDFSKLDDASFVQMIDWLYKIAGRYNKKIELILLGDIFELWETKPFYIESDVKDDKTKYAEIIENVKTKIVKIIDKHKDVFKKLKEFQQKGHRLVYVLGNHDDDIADDLAANQAQRFIKKRTGLTDKPLNLFRPFYTNKEFKLIARHGHEFDDFNKNEGLGNKPPGRLVTELIVYLLETYQAQQNIVKSENTYQIKGPFDKVDSVVSYLEYVKCLKSKGLVKSKLAAEIRKNLDPVIEKKVGKVATKLINDYISIIKGSNPLDQVVAILKLAEKVGGKREPTKDDVKNILGNDYNCFVMGHTHKPHIKKIENRKLWINSGNWQDSGRVDNNSPLCFKEAGHRYVTLLYKIEHLSGGQERENLEGGKKVFARMFTFPDAKLVDKGEYSLD